MASPTLEDIQREIARRGQQPAGSSLSGAVSQELDRRGAQLGPARTRETRGFLTQTGQQANFTLATLAGMPVDAINSALSVFGLDSAEPILGSRMMKKWLNRGAFGITPGAEEATNPWARALGITLGSAPLGLVGRAASMPGGVASLGTSRGLTAAAAQEALPAAGSTIGMGIANTVAPDSMAAEMIGSVAGGLALPTARAGVGGLVRGGLRGFGRQNQKTFASNLEMIRNELVDENTRLSPSIVANPRGPDIGSAAHRASAFERFISSLPGGKSPFRVTTDNLFKKIKSRLFRQLDAGRIQAERALGLDPLTQDSSAQARAGRLVIEGVGDFIDRFTTRSGHLFDSMKSRLGEYSATPTSTYRFFRGSPINPRQPGATGFQASGGLAPRLTRQQRSALRPGLTQGTMDTASPELDRVLNALPAHIRTHGNAFIQDVFFGPNATGQASYAQLDALRRRIGAAMNDKHLIGNADTAILKRAWAALTQDMEQIAKNVPRPGAAAGGPRTYLHPFQRMNRLYAAGTSRVEEVLQQVANKGASPDDVMRMIQTELNDPTSLGRLARSIGPDRWRIVANQVLRRMGMPTPANTFHSSLDESFDLMRWGQNFRAMSLKNPKAMQAVVGPRFRKYNAIANWLGEVAEVKSPVGTPGAVGTSVIGPALGTAVATSVTGSMFGALPLSFAAGAAAGALTFTAGASGASRLLTHPRFIDWLAQTTALRGTGSIQQHLARLSAIAASSDPVTADAIIDFGDMYSRLVENGQEQQ